MAEPPVLYHLPPSFYSQVARIVLEEKGVAWHSRAVAAGPPSFESYEPWYMRLNQSGTVPTLVHGEVVIADSLDIAHYVDESFDGPALTPEDAADRVQMEQWIERLYALNERELSYGSKRMLRIGRRINEGRLRALQRNREKYPELREVYDAKIEDIRAFRDAALDPAHVDRVRAGVMDRYDELDALLEDQEWIAGSSYSLADALWTVGIARHRVLDLKPLDGRPSLAQWYGRTRARPSFDSADVWERVKVGKMLRLVLGNMGGRLALVGLAAVGVAGVLWWLLRR